MKELFTGLLSVSVSGSIIVCLVILLRLLLKKSPRALICILWGIVILRLLIPFRFESELSLRPETPVYTKTDTTIFVDHQQEYMPDELPGYIPIQKTSDADQVVVDYVSIASAVWLVVAGGMLLYTLIVYICLKCRVRQAIKLDKNIYESSRVDAPFLLGYIRPRIYIPKEMAPENAQLVIAHERNHIRRGDHWFKLICFICLSLHWFNPLIWIAYVMICKDIEDACDEMVVRNMDEQGRKKYSTALLACGKGKPSLAACPVGFGETSIRHRIVNVLKYRKPAVWISIASIILIVAATVFFMTDPETKRPTYYEALCKSMGESVETVCENMGVSQDDLVAIDTDYNSVYALKSAVKYKGIPFEVRLWFRIDDKLSAFEYIAHVPGDREKAAAAAAEIGKQCLDAFGTPYQDSDSVDMVPVTGVTTQKLVDVYNVERVSGGMQASWKITDEMPQETIDFLLAYRETDLWKKRYSEMPVVRYPEVMLQLSTQRDLETDVISIYIKVSLAGGRYAPYQEKSLWEKVQNWLS